MKVKLAFIALSLLFFTSCNLGNKTIQKGNDLFLLTKIFEKKGESYCRPLDLMYGPSSEFVVFTIDSNKIAILDSNFTVTKKFSISDKIDWENIEDLNIFPVDSLGHNGFSFETKDKILHYFDYRTGIREFDLTDIYNNIEGKVYFKKVFFSSSFGPMIVVTTEVSKNVNFYIFSLSPFKIIEKVVRKGRPLKAYVSDNSSFFLIKGNNFKILSFYQGTSLSVKEFNQKISDFFVIRGEKREKAICVVPKENGTKEIWSFSLKDSSSQKLFEITGNQLNYFIPLDTWGSILTCMDDTLLYLYISNKLKKFVFPPVHSISTVRNLLGWNQVLIVIKFKDKKRIIFDELMKPIVSLPEFKKIYEFKKVESYGLVINQSNGFVISLLNLNYSLLKRALILTILIVFIIFGLLIIIWLFFKLRFLLIIHNKLLSNSENMILVVDNWGLVIFMNNQFKKLLSPFIDTSFHYRINIRHLFTSPALMKLRKLYESARIDRKEIEDVLEITIGERSATLVVNISPMKVKNRLIVGYIMSIEDISEIIENKRMITWAIMARNITHEIRNPLSSIILATRRLEKKLSDEKENLGEKYGKYLNSINSEAERINHLITTLLKLYVGNIEAYAFENLNSIVTESLESFSSKIPETISLSVKLKKKLPLVKVDKDLAILAISNIINNAIDAIDSKNGLITIRTYIDNTYAVLEIDDNGRGIKQDDLGKIIDLGYTTKETGFGLGLSIAKEIIEKFDGNLKIRSVEGKGTSVYLKFKIVNKDEKKDTKDFSS